MEIVLTILGILTVLFFFLSSLNAVKKLIKHPIILAIAKRHQIFGGLALVTALVHMTFAIILDETRITGLLALIGVISTVTLGNYFSLKKQKSLYYAHRVSGIVTAALIIVHIIFNSQF